MFAGRGRVVQPTATLTAARHAPHPRQRSRGPHGASSAAQRRRRVDATPEQRLLRSGQPPSATSGNGGGSKPARRGGSQREADWELPGSGGGRDYADTELFPGVEGTRAWAGLSPEARDLIQVAALFLGGPLLLSTMLRLSVVEPLISLAKADEHFHVDLTQAQLDEVASKVRLRRERLEYDALMRRAPPMSRAQVEEELRAEGAALEAEQQLQIYRVASNTISDGLSFSLLAGTALRFRSKLTLVKQGAFQRFLELRASTQAFILLLFADIFVGYHSSDGWFTLLDVLYQRYTLLDTESSRNAIRLFVATVPVCVDVAFKWWVYRYLRKISPGTQIILSEID